MKSTDITKLSPEETVRLARRYPMQVRWSDVDQAFVGSIPGLIGECCHDDSPEEVIPQLLDIAEDLVEDLSERGESLPPPPKLPEPLNTAAFCVLANTR